jgi:hypothetical protein
MRLRTPVPAADVTRPRNMQGVMTFVGTLTGHLCGACSK